jgi:hypothetical protein
MVKHKGKIFFQRKNRVSWKKPALKNGADWQPVFWNF